MKSQSPKSLTDEERAIYEWQMWVRDFGEPGQERLRGAAVLISRVGGLGGMVAYQLAAAGIGRLILAHAGNVKPSDLNRQLLMTHAGLGKSRIESASRRLLDLNPRLEIVAVAENINETNAPGLVRQADLIVDCAPVFSERFALNRQAVLQRKPMVECAMFELEGHVTNVIPGETACLACLYPVDPPAWKRQFPVFGAVAGTAGCIAAMEAIKLISGTGKPLWNEMLTFDLRELQFARRQLLRDPQCRVCGSSKGEKE